MRTRAIWLACFAWVFLPFLCGREGWSDVEMHRHKHHWQRYLPLSILFDERCQLDSTDARVVELEAGIRAEYERMCGKTIAIERLTKQCGPGNHHFVNCERVYPIPEEDDNPIPPVCAGPANPSTTPNEGAHEEPSGCR